jgi:hypothetical protein
MALIVVLAATLAYPRLMRWLILSLLEVGMSYARWNG